MITRQCDGAAHYGATMRKYKTTIYKRKDLIVK